MMSSTRWEAINRGVVLAILLFHGFCKAEKPPNYSFIHEATKAPLVSYFDYIIIGGGTAGCPLAATLSKRYSVLVLERGGSPYGNPNITELANFGRPLTDNSAESPSQQFISEDGVSNARPRALGGGTAINAGFYSRAEPEIVRDAGWDVVLVNSSYEWVEKVVAFKPELGPWESAWKDSLLEAGVVPDNGLMYDHLVGTKTGGSIFDNNGHRHTAADLLQYANPKRLSVVLRASVQKILFKSKSKGSKSGPIAHGVVYKDRSGIKHRAYLKGQPKDEIILSAGALGSPQLLMLSGIGPKDQLQAHNITIILEQEMVGQGMADNPLNAIFVPSPIPIKPSKLEVVGITSFGSYIESIGGINLFGGTAAEYYGGFDPTIGGLIAEKVNGPLSSGYLRLLSVNVDDNPSVKFNYFQDPIDLQKCVKGMETILHAIKTNAYSKYTYKNITTQDILNIAVTMPRSLPRHDNTNTSLPQFCKDTIRTIWHYHGGCQIGRVVDHDYKVIGIKGLRVIDGSTFLKSPGTNPQATVLMLGRYMGVKILKDREQLHKPIWPIGWDAKAKVHGPGIES